MKATKAVMIGPKSLETSQTVRKLQKSLHAKAKAEPSYRFYSLWDKVYRADILQQAFWYCHRNGGTAGADGVSFADIESRGLQKWLENLQQELKAGSYKPMPLLRVWILKSNGGQRPLSIPTILDRVVQTAVLMVLGPIFEADLLPQQYAFRPKLDAKMAVRRAFFHISQYGRREIVDADLQDFFGSIPHASMMRCIARRIVDGTLLGCIKKWLCAAVLEKSGRYKRRTSQAKREKRGIAQGSPVSPLLANLYFRRFILAWEKFGYAARLDAQIVNYADDQVICCRLGNGKEAMACMRKLMNAIGLTVNNKKTRLIKIPEDSFCFLGFRFGRLYAKNGRPYFGTRPSNQSLKSILEKVHYETSHRWSSQSVEERVKRLNQVTRGWCGYFNQGPVLKAYKVLRVYQERRLRRWLQRKHGRRGTGYRQYPDMYLYEKLGLFKPPVTRRDLLSAKA